MKFFVALLCGVLCSVPTSLAGQSEESDPYSIKLVQTALKTRSEGIVIAKVQTHLARMGDRVSVALLKNLSADMLTDPTTIEGFLPVIRDAFSAPGLIATEVDKEPRVTLFFLKYVRQSISNTRTQQKIDETIQFVKLNTGA
jgi:hypothetical protein